MQHIINRRGFIGTLLLAVSAPSSLIQSHVNLASQNSASGSSKALAHLTPIDDHFTAVDGWILPTTSLIKGSS